jgi:hypothetical protein
MSAILPIARLKKATRPWQHIGHPARSPFQEPRGERACRDFRRLAFKDWDLMVFTYIIIWKKVI